MTIFTIQTGRFDFSDVEYEGSLDEFLDYLYSTFWFITEDGYAIQTKHIQCVFEQKK